VDDNWYWATYLENAGYQPPPALSYYRPTDGQVWQWNHSELAFRLLGPDGDGNGAAVPEGGTSALLMGISVGALAFFGHRRRRSTL
jgi:hypothetical protein